MFTPFVAPRAENLVAEYRAERQLQNEILIQSYLNIIHVHVERACAMGRQMTGGYIPTEIKKETIERLCCAGFTVAPQPNRVNWYFIEW